MNKRIRGFTLVELLVVISIIAILIATLLPALSTAQRNAKLSSDMQSTRQIHQGWVSYSSSNGGNFPTPSHIDRMPVNTGTGAIEMPGRGAPQFGFNHHAAIHAASIALQIYNPQLTVSADDANGNVFLFQEGSREAYYVPNPPMGVEDVHWDYNFACDLATGSNVSFASMPLHGKRFKRQWKAGGSSSYTLIASRGPENGEPQETDDLCHAYRNYGPPDKYEGLSVQNDGSTNSLDTFWPTFIPELPGGVKDNLFMYDCGTVNGTPGVCTPNKEDSLCVLHGYDVSGGGGQGGDGMADHLMGCDPNVGIDISAYQNGATWDPQPSDP